MKKIIITISFVFCLLFSKAQEDYSAHSQVQMYLIQKIYFIDSNRLLVIWNNKVDSLTAHINYDLWEFKSSKWELIKSKNYNLKPKQDDLFNPDTYSHFDLRNYNDLAFIVLDFPFDYKNYLNKPVSSLKKDMEIYYINNNPRLSLFQWKIK